MGENCKFRINSNKFLEGVVDANGHSQTREYRSLNDGKDVRLHSVLNRASLPFARHAFPVTRSASAMQMIDDTIAFFYTESTLSGEKFPQPNGFVRC